MSTLIIVVSLQEDVFEDRPYLSTGMNKSKFVQRSRTPCEYRVCVFEEGASGAQRVCVLSSQAIPPVPIPLSLSPPSMTSGVENKKRSQLSKNQLKRLKKKNKPAEEAAAPEPEPEAQPQTIDEPQQPQEEQQVENDLSLDNVPDEFKQIFLKFQPVDETQTVSKRINQRSTLTTYAGRSSQERVAVQRRRG